MRCYQKLDVLEVKKHLLIYGDLSGQCANCSGMELKLQDTACPQCGAEFRFLAFRHFKSHLPKILQITEERPGVILVDHDDFQKAWGAVKAEEFLK